MDFRSKFRSKLKSKWNKLKAAVINMFIRVTKGREINALGSVIMINVSFLQIYGTIFEESNYFSWKDTVIGEHIYSVFHAIRVIPFFLSNASTSLYWFIFGLGRFKSNFSNIGGFCALDHLLLLGKMHLLKN